MSHFAPRFPQAVFLAISAIMSVLKHSKCCDEATHVEEHTIGSTFPPQQLASPLIVDAWLLTVDKRLRRPNPQIELTFGPGNTQLEPQSSPSLASWTDDSSSCGMSMPPLEPMSDSSPDNSDAGSILSALGDASTTSSLTNATFEGSSMCNVCHGRIPQAGRAV